MILRRLNFNLVLLSTIKDIMQLNLLRGSSKDLLCCENALSSTYGSWVCKFSSVDSETRMRWSLMLTCKCENYGLLTAKFWFVPVELRRSWFTHLTRIFSVCIFFYFQCSSNVCCETVLIRCETFPEYFDTFPVCCEYVPVWSLIFPIGYQSFPLNDNGQNKVKGYWK